MGSNKRCHLLNYRSRNIWKYCKSWDADLVSYVHLWCQSQMFSVYRKKKKIKIKKGICLAVPIVSAGAGGLYIMFDLTSCLISSPFIRYSAVMSACVAALIKYSDFGIFLYCVWHIAAVQSSGATNTYHQCLCFLLWFKWGLTEETVCCLHHSRVIRCFNIGTSCCTPFNHQYQHESLQLCKSYPPPTGAPLHSLPFTHFSVHNSLIRPVTTMT